MAFPGSRFVFLIFSSLVAKEERSDDEVSSHAAT